MRRDPFSLQVGRRPTQDPYGKGSKSELEAAFVETPDGRYVLRRKAGPVSGDAKLKRYAGHDIECDGIVVGTTLLAERIEVVKVATKPGATITCHSPFNFRW